MDWRLGLQDPEALPFPTPRGQVSFGDELSDGGPGPIHLRLLPDSATVSPSGRLVLGGVDVLSIVEEMDTPVFIYDEQHLRSRCREARRAFPDGVAYASKAFLCSAMAALANKEGVSLDVASEGEMYVALQAGVAPDRLILHGSNKSLSELATAITLGVGRIVVDSFDEMERLERLSSCVGLHAEQKVLLRVNPCIEVRTHAFVATGQADSKFGFSLASGAAQDAVDRLTKVPGRFDLVGLHTHVGSQIFDLKAMGDAIAALAPLFRKFEALHELCIGGGLGVPYRASDQRAPSLMEWSKSAHCAARAAGIPASVRLTAEPGRAISAAAAITCYTIGTIKSTRLATNRALHRTEEATRRTYVGVDGGMSDNIRPALYGSSYEAFLPRAVAKARPMSAVVVGKHCESGDVLVRDAWLPEDTVVGDVVATPVTGAYGYSMASNFNKVLRPPIVFVAGGEYRVVARRETYSDLLRLDTSL